MIAEDLTALEALGVAIRSEIDAQEIYQDLADLSQNELLKERFLNLVKEEKQHQLILEKKYNEMFPDVPLKLPESQMPKHINSSAARKKMSLKDVLKIAIDEEKRARDFYLDCAEYVTDLSGKRIFRFLADMEFSHQMIISAEYEMVEKYPQYFGELKSWEVENSLRKERE
ncbi:ferritin-like domain-containing protein [Rosettibacter firmus]|uniref:ferritin-like domain-containing protein n=1 Tax=Rosettibacter firmus TaxID=3111522 RepID=UPI00336C23D4